MDLPDQAPTSLVCYFIGNIGDLGPFMFPCTEAERTPYVLGCRWWWLANWLYCICSHSSKRDATQACPHLKNMFIKDKTAPSVFWWARSRLPQSDSLPTKPPSRCGETQLWPSSAWNCYTAGGGGEGGPAFFSGPFFWEKLAWRKRNLLNFGASCAVFWAPVTPKWSKYGGAILNRESRARGWQELPCPTEVLSRIRFLPFLHLPQLLLGYAESKYGS